AAERHAKFLADEKVRVDLFGLREGGVIEGKLLGPIRPEIPRLKSGGKYLVETVVRTLNLGHLFSQGTVDSNELWAQLIPRSAARAAEASGIPADSGGTARSIPTRISSTFTCSTANAGASTAAIPRTSSCPCTISRSPPAPARSSTSPWRSPAARPARSRSRP